MTSAIYTEIDLTGIDLNESDPQSLPGITKKLSAAITTGAPILLTGVVSGTTPISPMFCVIASTSIMLPIGATLTLDPDNDTLEVAS